MFECVHALNVTHSQTPGGLAWTNFHVIPVQGMTSVNSVAKSGTNSAHTKRRDQTQPKTQAEICQFIRQSKTELGGTVASVTTAITAALLTRLLLRTRALFRKPEPERLAISFGQWFGIYWSDWIDGGASRGSGSIFIAYEMPILVKAFMGLTESSAEAWVSGCVGYQVGGAVTIAIVFFLIVASIYFTYTSVQKKHIYFTYTSKEESMIMRGGQIIYGETVTGARCGLEHGDVHGEEAQPAQSLGDSSTCSILFAQDGKSNVCSTSGARFHGKWKPHKHQDSKVWWARIQDFVKEYRGECWWYKFWVMLVWALTAIFIKCISDATGNTIAILCLKFVDIIVMGCFAPHNDKWAYWQDMWVAFVNLVQAIGITYYILEKQKGDEISILFVVTTVAGISPLVLCALRDAGSQVLEQMQQFGSPSSVFRKLKILMGRGASYHSNKIDARLDQDVELSAPNSHPLRTVFSNINVLQAQVSPNSPPSNTASVFAQTFRTEARVVRISNTDPVGPEQEHQQLRQLNRMQQEGDSTEFAWV